MKIGELAARTALNASAIRYYEKVGLLAPPHRVSGQRRYPDDAVHRVLLICFAGDMGFTLGEIKVFLNGLRTDAPVGPRWRKLAHRKIAEVEADYQTFASFEIFVPASAAMPLRFAANVRRALKPQRKSQAYRPLSLSKTRGKSRRLKRDELLQVSGSSDCQPSLESVSVAFKYFGDAKNKNVNGCDIQSDRNRVEKPAVVPNDKYPWKSDE